jgi:hypothetical protein
MTAVLDWSTNAGNRGSHYTRGADFLYYVNELTAQIYRQPVNPATQIARQPPRALSSLQSVNLNLLAGADLRWVGGTTKQVQAQNGAKVKKLAGSFTSLEAIALESLATIAWDTIASNNFEPNEDGLSTTGNFYAVRIPTAGTDPHYAKVRIFKDTATRIEWSTYIIGTRPAAFHTLGPETPAPRYLVMSELGSDIYVSGGVGAEGYVVKYQRIVSGPFPQYSSYPIPLTVADSPAPLLGPQQMVIDGNSIYVVAEGGLFLLQPESYTQVQVVSGITAPVGLLLDRQRSSVVAYISNQAGHVYVVDITEFNAPTFDANGNPTGVASWPIAASSPSADLELGGPSGFLTWADDAHTAFYAAVVGPSGRIRRVELASTAAPMLANPWSVVVLAEGSLSAVCDAAIYDIEDGSSEG